jgi:oxygen-dependent protoporphyrinogen oxidase
VPRVAIIGGGISGLSTAYYLRKRGIPSTIFESRPWLGGVIQTQQVEGCTIEGGPDSFLSAKPAALELIRELGLEADVIGSNDHLRVTYIRKGGRLIPLPDGLMMMAPTKLMPMVTTPLLSWGTKIRMGMELLRKPKTRSGDVTVAQFIQEHYGAEAVDYLAEPLLSGIYGGDPNDLSAESVLTRFVTLSEKYGSLTRGVLAERAKARANGKSAPLFRTLKGGLGELVDALTPGVEARHCRVEAVERSGSGFRVHAGVDSIEADHLILSCEAYNAAPLVRAFDNRLAELLGSAPYSSSTTVALGFHAADLSKRPDGFGFLVPKKERRRIVACTWIGTKFPFRVPEDKVVARCFLSGSDTPEEEAVNSVTAELAEITGISAQPIFSRVFRWPRAMAQYPVGHAARVSEIEGRVAAIPGLHLAGNAYHGIGIPDCIKMGRTAAEKIAGQ